MTERQTIIGFTEAELGFFLAILALLFLVVLSEPTETDPPVVEVPEDSLTSLASRISRQEQMADSLRAELAIIREGSSDMTPYCYEPRVGIATGPLLTVKILSPETFEVQGDTVDRAGLRERTAGDRAAASRAGCVHEVLVDFLPELTASELHLGRRFLSSMFRLRSID